MRLFHTLFTFCTVLTVAGTAHAQIFDDGTRLGVDEDVDYPGDAGTGAYGYGYNQPYGGYDYGYGYGDYGAGYDRDYLYGEDYDPDDWFGDDDAYADAYYGSYYDEGYDAGDYGEMADYGEYYDDDYADSVYGDGRESYAYDGLYTEGWYGDDAFGDWYDLD